MHRFKLSLQFLKPKPHNYLNPKPFSTSHFENSGSLTCRVQTRSVIRFRGPDAVRYLQGLVTNDVRRLEEPGKRTGSSTAVATPNLPAFVVPPVYTAILNPQGRFLFDMFLYRPPRPDEKLDSTGSGPGSSSGELELFADVDGASLDELLELLRKYRLRSKVDIERVASDFSCWQRFGPKLHHNKSSSTQDPEAESVGSGAGVDYTGGLSSQGSKDGWKWHQDPRCNCLGYRGIFPSQSTPPLVEADKDAEENHYLLWRLEKGVAEGPSEIPKGEAIPLEYNLAGLNAISFDKGCYVGQELVARTHHLGVIRKRLLPLEFVDDSGKEVEDKVAPNTGVIAETSGKRVGTITTALGGRGLGLLRLDAAFKEPGSLAIQGQENVNVKFHIPDWWPPEWSVDYHQQSAVA